MRVFVAGASGAIGIRLVPQLIEAGHEVIGSHTAPERAELLRSLGAKPVRLDVLDAGAVRDQSFAPYRYIREGGPVKTEDDPLDPTPPQTSAETVAAMVHLEHVVTDFGGIALRYGAFYGAANDGWAHLVHKRRFPIVGNGSGIIPFIHLEDAASATVLALDHDGPAIYNIVDDDPAPMREWLPVLAQALGAKPPRRLPAWLARLLAGEAAVMMGTEARGASNAKAKRELGWELRYPTWRTGFSAAYSASSAAGEPTPQPAARASHSHG